MAKTNLEDNAFPLSLTDKSGLWQNGMSKRFYAACAAMQGLYSICSNEDMLEAFNKGASEDGSRSLAEYIAKQSFIAADELLKQEHNGKKD